MKPIETISVKTSIKAPLSKVWRAWTDPNHITKWNFANSEWCCPRAENDLRPGGPFSWRMEAKNGSMGFDFNGTYNMVNPEKEINYTLEDGRKVWITFHEEGDEVIVKEAFEAEGTNSDEMQRKGWQAILENFKAHVEGLG